MIKKQKLFFALLIILLVIVGCGETAVSPTVTVIDSLSGLPLPRADVRLVTPDMPEITATTDDSGVAILEISESYDGKTAELIITARGFTGIILEVPLLPGEDDALVVELDPAIE